MAVITDSTFTYTMGVDAVSLAARVTPYNTDGTSLAQSQYSYVANPAGLVVSGINDGNAVPLRLDRFGNLGITAITPVIWDEFEGATLNSQRWTSVATAFVDAQTALGHNLNSTSLTTINAVNVCTSNKRIIRTGRSPLQYRTRKRITNTANSVNDFGFADSVSAATQIPNGAYFQAAPTGTLQGVVTTNSTDAPVTINWLNSNTFNSANAYVWDILVDDDNVTFTIQDTSTGAIVALGNYRMPLAGSRMFAATHLSVFRRCFNTGSAPATAPIHLTYYDFAGYVDMATGAKPWADILSTNHFSSSVVPTTIAQAQTFSNSAEPASMTLSNTTAGLTTLGGKFQFAAVAGAVTDYLIFSFTVPAPFTLVVKSITIDLWNTGAASAQTLFTWGLFANSTTSSAAGNGLRRFIGSQSFGAAAIGQNATQIFKQFNVPVTTDAGRFFGIILRMPVGTATASDVFAGSVDIDGYFE